MTDSITLEESKEMFKRTTMETWGSRAGLSCISLVSRATSSNINAGSREERTSRARSTAASRGLVE